MGRNRRKYFITIADGDLDDHLFLKKAIREIGLQYEVSSVFNGLQLINFLLKREAYIKSLENPDLVFLDLKMPVVDGFEALIEIRKHIHLVAIPIFIHSTSQDEGSKAKAISLGASAYFVKPISQKDLRELLNSVCSGIASSSEGT
jgi:CheY-like chemotaxis protein